MVIPLFVGRPKSIKALEAATETGKNILLVAQKSAATDDPAANEVYQVCTVSSILQMLKLPDGTVKVLVEGSYRARIKEFSDDGNFSSGKVEKVPMDDADDPKQKRCGVHFFAV